MLLLIFFTYIVFFISKLGDRLNGFPYRLFVNRRKIDVVPTAFHTYLSYVGGKPWERTHWLSAASSTTLLKYHRLSYHLLCDRTIINLLIDQLQIAIRIQNVLKQYIDAMLDLLIMSINKIPIAPGALEQSTHGLNNPQMYVSLICSNSIHQH